MGATCLGICITLSGRRQTRPLLGLANREAPTIVAAMELQMHLSSVSGNCILHFGRFDLNWKGLIIDLTTLIDRYLDQLGRSSTYDTKTYCRQTLIGGNYGLLNTTTFIPNPDYYRSTETNLTIMHNLFLNALSFLTNTRVGLLAVLFSGTG